MSDYQLKKDAEIFLANVYATNNLTPARDSLAAAVELLKRFVNQAPFRIGDVVTIAEKAVDVPGWNDIWVEGMDSTVGKSGVIEFIAPDDSAQVAVEVSPGNETRWNYPLCALRHFAPPAKPAAKPKAKKSAAKPKAKKAVVRKVIVKKAVAKAKPKRKGAK